MKTDNRSPLLSFMLLWIAGYAFLFMLPFPVRHIPFAHELIAAPISLGMESLNFLVGRQLLGLEDLAYDGGRGSGDTRFDYVYLVTWLLLSFLLAVLLFLLRSKLTWIRKTYPSMIVYARYFVGLTLIHYGVAKFMIGQFPGPSLISMDQSFGDFSPMGLAWRFFGYSDLYKVFMGLSEITAGALLLFRRTVVVGAMLSIAVVTNIVLVNFSFDVPVKILSSHLLLFSVLILAPYLKQLFGLLILHRPGQLSYQPRTFLSPKKKWAYRLVKFYMVVFVPVSMMVGHVLSQSYRSFDNPWEGAYEILSDGEDMVDLKSDAKWARVILDGKTLLIERVSGDKSYYSIVEVGENGLISLSGSPEGNDTPTLHLREAGEEYQLAATFGDEQFTLKAKRKMKSDYFLLRRGFHWINEYPVNR
ncbi:hypothetical protein [Cyclobacterium plantarum]|uniref:DoxX family protein n=1 Tax=Cyclobacterium plantarum TaxID=2716263 RepID=A0ABX0H7R9_9BACT|nr:hypothetical protein [Cyclobacterium plantarum]NHE57929.1 hypothetical protein [Cyclobacterium plantarum]